MKQSAGSSYAKSPDVGNCLDDDTLIAKTILSISTLQLDMMGKIKKLEENQSVILEETRLERAKHQAIVDALEKHYDKEMDRFMEMVNILVSTMKRREQPTTPQAIAETPRAGQQNVAPRASAVPGMASGFVPPAQQVFNAAASPAAFFANQNTPQHGFSNPLQSIPSIPSYPGFQSMNQQQLPNLQQLQYHLMQQQLVQQAQAQAQQAAAAQVQQVAQTQPLQNTALTSIRGIQSGNVSIDSSSFPSASVPPSISSGLISNTSSVTTIKKPGGESEKKVEKGFGDAFKPAPGSWECSSCYTRNKAEANVCPCCGTQKDGTVTGSTGGTSCFASKPMVAVAPPKEGAFGLGIAAGVPFSKSTTGPAVQNLVSNTSSVTTIKKPGGELENKVEKGFGDAFKPAPGSWECASCYTRNKADANVCPCCGTQKDGTVVGSTGGSSYFASKPMVTVAPPKEGAFSFGITTGVPFPKSTTGPAVTSLQNSGATTTASFSFGYAASPATTVAPVSTTQSTSSSLPAAGLPTFSFSPLASKTTSGPTSSVTSFSFSTTDVPQGIKPETTTASPTTTKPLFSFAKPTLPVTTASTPPTTAAAAASKGTFSHATANFKPALPDVTKGPSTFSFKPVDVKPAASGPTFGGSPVFGSKPTMPSAITPPKPASKEGSSGTPKPLANSLFGGSAGVSPFSGSVFGGGSSSGGFAALAAKAQGENKPATSSSVEQSITPFQGGSTGSADRSVFAFGSEKGSHEKEDKSRHEDDAEEFVPTAQFEPVVPLPALVEAKTGEEDEKVLFKTRAKLYRFVKSLNEYKERGVGDIKILQNNEGKCRVVMRRDQVLKVCANTPIRPGMKISKKPNTENTCMWACQDYSEDAQGTSECFVARFKTAELADDFMKVFRQAIDAPPPRQAVDATMQQASKIPMKDDPTGSSGTPKPLANSLFGTSAGLSPFSGSVFGSGSSSGGAAALAVKGQNENKPATSGSVEQKITPFQGGCIGSLDRSVFSFGSEKSSHEKEDKSRHEDDAEEFVPTAQFEPVVPLPALVEAKTGEEDEKVLFKARSKLYRFVKSSNEYKERGVGDIKILQNSEGKCRVVMRRDQVLKVCANSPIRPGMKVGKKPNTENTCMWACQDYSEDAQGTNECFVARFKTAELADDFIKVFRQAIDAPALRQSVDIPVQQASKTPLKDSAPAVLSKADMPSSSKDVVELRKSEENGGSNDGGDYAEDNEYEELKDYPATVIVSDAFPSPMKPGHKTEIKGMYAIGIRHDINAMEIDALDEEGTSRLAHTVSKDDKFISSNPNTLEYTTVSDEGKNVKVVVVFDDPHDKDEALTHLHKGVNMAAENED